MLVKLCFFVTNVVFLSMLFGYWFFTSQLIHLYLLVSIGIALLLFIFFGIHHIYQEVKNKEYWFEQILDNLPTPLSITDNQMNWTFINKPVQQLFDKPKKSFIGKPCHHWGATICNSENCGINRLRQGKNETFFSQFGRDFRVDTHYLYDRRHNKIGHLEVCTDVTAIVEVSRLVEKEKQQKLDLEASYAKLKLTQKKLVESEKMAALGNLVAGIAHEVNTPLGVCITAVSALKHSSQRVSEQIKNKQITLKQLNKFSAENIEALQVIDTSLARAVDLITTFKQVAIDTKDQEIQTFCVNEHLELFASTIQQELAQANATFLIDCNENVYIESFPSALEVIYRNLVSNSLTHSKANKDKHISISVRQENNTVFLHYKDNGTGICKDMQSVIFEPFITTRRGQGNIGLGLHIVYNLIVHGLQGNIHYQDTEQQGAAFLIELPASPDRIKNTTSEPLHKRQIKTKVSFD